LWARPRSPIRVPEPQRSDVSNARRASAALAATTLVWGSTFVVVRDLVGEEHGVGLPPLLLVSVRFAMAAAAALALLFVTGERIAPDAWRRGAILGAITAGGFAFQTLGLQYTTASRSAFITNISLLLVPVFGMWLGRKRPGSAVWMGSLVALGGLWLLEFPWDQGSRGPEEALPFDRYLKGDLLTLGCATFFAFQILATESYSPRVSLIPLVSVQFATCGVLSGVVSVLTGEWGRLKPLSTLETRHFLEIVYLALVATGVCLLVQAWAQRYTTSTRAALIFMLETVFAALLAYLIFRERMTSVQWAGAALVFLGVLGAELLSGAARDDPQESSAPAGASRPGW
jgi:drug/metabolite transporter (DMT)-like permease